MNARSLKDIRQIPDLLRLFDACVEEDPDRGLLFAPFAENSSGDEVRSATRTELRDLAGDVTAKLAASELRPNSLVGLSATNGPGFLAGLIALWRRSCVPILLDCGTPANRVLQTASTLGATSLLHCEKCWPAGRDAFRWTPLPTPWKPAPTNAAVIKLTSGSTGEPRGIVISPRAVWADTLAIERAMGIRADDRLIAAVPMSFSYGFGTVAVPALLAGRQLVLPDPDRPLAILTAARRCAATVLPIVPVFLSALLKRDGDWRLPESVRLVVSAGAPLSKEVAKEFRARFGLPIHVFYGASECGGITYDRKGDAGERGTVGTNVPGVEITIDSATKLIEVRSPAVAEGYLPPLPDVLAGGRYRTNDEAVRRGDEFELTGRRGTLINIGGHKINPRELERVIADLPGVDAVHVTGISVSTGEIETCCAVIESRRDRVSRQQVHDWCRARMPAFKLPRRILIVREIPRNGRGKVEAGAIRRLAAQTTA